jgi:hypothetical protein
LTHFHCGAQEKEKGHGRANAAAAGASQIGEGSEDRIGGKVLDLVVDATLINQVHYAALGGRETTDDHGNDTNQPSQTEDAEEGEYAQEAFSPQSGGSVAVFGVLGWPPDDQDGRFRAACSPQLSSAATS